MFSLRIVFVAVGALVSASGASAAEHPCKQLATNSILGEIWPDEFTSTMKELAPRPRGAFQKTADYEESERKRLADLAARSPMFAVVSQTKWSEFTYDADTEILAMVPSSPHAALPCGAGKTCNQLVGWSDEQAGRLEHPRSLPPLTFKVAPADLEEIAKREQPILYYVVSPKYPYWTAGQGGNLPVDLHCAALVSDEDGSIRDEDDTLLHIWAPLEQTMSSEIVAELFKPVGCGEADCKTLRTTGWGAVRIGAEYSSIRAAVGGDAIDTSSDFWCGVGGSAWPDGISASLNARQEIDNIYIDNGSSIRAPAVMTDKGIGIGSSLAALKRAYPSAKPQPEYDGQVDYVVSAGPARVLLFRTAGGRVTMMGLGDQPGSERDGCPPLQSSR
jgi:hypothetical protein